MNEGHRDPWCRDLRALDQMTGDSCEAVNGLRVVDADSPLRAVLTEPTHMSADSGATETNAVVAPVISAEGQATAAAVAAARSVKDEDLDLGEDSLEDEMLPRHSLTSGDCTGFLYFLCSMKNYLLR